MLMMLMYWVEAYILIKKNTEAVAVPSKETGLEVNAEKNKCMVMSRDKHAEQSQNIKTGNKLFARVEQF
jgi:hypothetical protein